MSLLKPGKLAIKSLEARLPSAVFWRHVDKKRTVLQPFFRIRQEPAEKSSQKE